MPGTSPLIVVLEGAPIGEVRQSGSQLRLTYDDGYRNDPEATPLSVSMPRTVDRHGDAAIRNWMWGLLPDNELVIGQWARRWGVSPSSPFHLLGTPVGHDCAGAVQFVAPDDLDHVINRSGKVDWLSLDDVARRLIELKDDSTKWLGTDFRGRFSLGGAQAKTALRWDERRGWGLPSGSAPTTHILKPGIAGLDDSDINEHLCLTAAGLLGIPAARTEILDFGEVTAVCVERYDRRVVDGELVRIHQEDLVQAAGKPPAKKYEGDGGPGAKAITTILRANITGPPLATAIERFGDALLFNWLIAGTDAHAKNYSLLHAGPQTRLAPLYDVASYLPFDTSKGHKIDLAMKFGGERRLNKTGGPSTWARLAADLNLPVDQVRARAADLADRVADAFSTAAAGDAVSALPTEAPAVLTDAVAARARACADVLRKH